MSQLANQTDLKTDSYTMPRPSTNDNQADADAKKKMLGIAAATLLLGGSAWAISRKIIELNKDRSSESTEPETPTPAGLPADIDVAGKVTDDMSFEQAFGAARDEVGMGGVFSWHGHWYNTFDKEEWSGLSLEQRREFTEMITGEKLPVKPYHTPILHASGDATTPTEEAEPTIIEGYLNGQRVMGLDFDQDGIIDTVVMDAADGYTYRVVDAVGDQGLDTLYRYDSLDGELVEIEKIEEPFVLSNDQFSQGLEASMSKEVVDSILEDDVPAMHSAPSTEPHDLDESEPENTIYLANSYEADDDTYVNNGDVHDMDE